MELTPIKHKDINKPVYSPNNKITVVESRMLEILKQYADAPVYPTYGIDEFLNMHNIFDKQTIIDSCFVIEKATATKLLVLIHNKRIRFLRNELSNPSLTPSQVTGIKYLLDQENVKKEENNTGIKIELVTALGGNNE